MSDKAPTVVCDAVPEATLLSLHHYLTLKVGASGILCEIEGVAWLECPGCATRFASVEPQAGIAIVALMRSGWLYTWTCTEEPVTRQEILGGFWVETHMRVRCTPQPPLFNAATRTMETTE